MHPQCEPQNAPPSPQGDFLARFSSRASTRLNTNPRYKSTLARVLHAALLIALMLMPILLVLQPLPAARAQDETETESEFVNQLYAGYDNATEVSVTAPAILGYATKSNVSIYTAFMDQQQLEELTQPSDIANAIYAQSGEVNYDALLAAPGTYYLVVYSPSAPANITEVYIINPDISIRNSTTSVGEFITIQPSGVFSIPLHVETLGSSSQVDILGASTQVVQYQVLDNITQQAVFTSPENTITNFTVSPSVSSGYNLTLGEGYYILYIRDDSPSPASVYFQYNIIPAYVNPYVLHSGPPSPTGIVAYGVYNESGDVGPVQGGRKLDSGFRSDRRAERIRQQIGHPPGHDPAQHCPAGEQHGRGLVHLLAAERSGVRDEHVQRHLQGQRPEHDRGWRSAHESDHSWDRHHCGLQQWRGPAVLLRELRLELYLHVHLSPDLGSLHERDGRAWAGRPHTNGRARARRR